MTVVAATASSDGDATSIDFAVFKFMTEKQSPSTAGARRGCAARAKNTRYWLNAKKKARRTPSFVNDWRARQESNL
jgi:hypothetical protein